MTKVTAARPKARVIYSFTPNITFNQLDSFGNILSGYEKDMTYHVREGNDKLDKVVQVWLKRNAKDEKGDYIPISNNPDDGNLKLVRLGE